MLYYMPKPFTPYVCWPVANHAGVDGSGEGSDYGYVQSITPVLHEEYEAGQGTYNDINEHQDGYSMVASMDQDDANRIRLEGSTGCGFSNNERKEKV